jgi:hypothetical protein
MAFRQRARILSRLRGHSARLRRCLPLCRQCPHQRRSPCLLGRWHRLRRDQHGWYHANNRNRHVFDAPNFELRQLDPNVAIPFLNETNGMAIIARNMRMEGCSPFAARHTAAATDCEYDVAWAQSYAIRVDYTPSATRADNAVFNRHRAPTSRLTRLLAHIPNIRAGAFWQSRTEIGVEGACIMARPSRRPLRRGHGAGNIRPLRKLGADTGIR